MAEAHNNGSYEGDALLRKADQLVLYQQLGRIEGSLRQMSAEFQRITLAIGRVDDKVESANAALTGHMVSDARAFEQITGLLTSTKEVVDRIKKPVDTFISLRNFLIGVLSLLAAIGAIWGAFSYLPTWFGGWFHR